MNENAVRLAGQLGGRPALMRAVRDFRNGRLDAFPAGSEWHERQLSWDEWADALMAYIDGTTPPADQPRTAYDFEHPQILQGIYECAMHAKIGANA